MMICGYRKKTTYISHRIHAWYIYLHSVDICGLNVGKYTVRPMDMMGMGNGVPQQLANLKLSHR